MASETEIYQLKVTLKDIEPPVWRRIQVPATYSFWDLHVAIQDAMGWLDCHLHEFLLVDPEGREVSLGIPDDDFESDSVPGWDCQLSDFLSLDRPLFEYVYDFGDDWRHEVELEGIVEADPGVRYPRCMSGSRACPPEDCGGTPGYQELLKVLAEPEHEEYDGARIWADSQKGGAFSPEQFDPDAVEFSDPAVRYRRAFLEEPMSDERIYEIIDAFDYYDGRYKKEEMEEAVALREQITPHLLEILEELAEDPELFISEERYANTYAVALLSYFREPAAHLPIIRAFSVPTEILDELWGDMATETLPTLLLQTCNGSLEDIKALVLDRNVDDYVRGSAAGALTYAVARGMADREEIVGFLSGLFTGDEAERGSDFWSGIVCDLTDLHPGDAMEVIRKAYADGLIADTYVTLEEVEDEALKEKDTTLEMFRRRVDRRIPADVHDYLSWFACFRGSERPAAALTGNRSKAQKSKKKGDRAKKKMAKKSKRKNRK